MGFGAGNQLFGLALLSIAEDNSEYEPEHNPESNYNPEVEYIALCKGASVLIAP
jgi:hypothetical protein